MKPFGPAFSNRWLYLTLASNRAVLRYTSKETRYGELEKLKTSFVSLSPSSNELSSLGASHPSSCPAFSRKVSFSKVFLKKKLID